MLLNFIVYNISRLQKNRYLSDLPLLTYRCIDQGVKHMQFLTKKYPEVVYSNHYKSHWAGINEIRQP